MMLVPIDLPYPMSLVLFELFALGDFTVQTRPLTLQLPSAEVHTTLPPGELTLWYESTSSSEPSGKPDEWPCKRGASMNSTQHVAAGVDLSSATRATFQDALSLVCAWPLLGSGFVESVTYRPWQ
jgi:hypothetical protein